MFVCCQELQIRRERLRERAENVKKEEEKLRQYKLDTAKELQVRQHCETNSWIMSKLN